MVIEAMDLRIFLEAQPHTLLIGSEDLALSILATYQRHLASPIVEWRPPAPLNAPPAGTLVIWDVDRLKPPQQRDCLAWMDRHAAAVQVISVAARTIFPLVQARAFMPELYYRLNTICLPLTRNAAALTAPIPKNDEHLVSSSSTRSAQPVSRVHRLRDHHQIRTESLANHPRRLKNWTARSCRSAAARVPNVPRFLRLPVFGSAFFEYKRYLPDVSFRITCASLAWREQGLCPARGCRAVGMGYVWR
jgi:hypothetical protein